MKRSIIAIVLSTFACSNVPTTPPDTFINLTERLETEHFVFHYEPGDFVDVERLEAFMVWAKDYLNVTPPKKIDYYKSKEWEDQYAVSASGGRARWRPYEVWTRWPYHPHECTHLLAGLIGRPTSFFGEGIAVALQYDPLNDVFTSWDWRSGEWVHDVVRQYKADGTLYPLTSIIDQESFWEADDVLKCYRQAGSFVGYLIDAQGLDRLKTLYADVRYDDSPETILEKFETVYAMSLQEAEAKWLEFLG